MMSISFNSQVLQVVFNEQFGCFVPLSQPGEKLSRFDWLAFIKQSFRNLEGTLVRMVR